MPAGSTLLKHAWSGISSVGRAVGGSARTPVKSALKGADVIQENLLTGYRAADLLKSPKAQAIGALHGTAGALMFDDLVRAGAPEFSDPVILAKSRMRQQHTQAAMENQFRLRQQEAQQTLMALAQRNPQLFSEVAAGRRLPKGGVVFGGRPRYDLLQTLAYDMVDGVFPKAADPEQALMQALQEIL